ncbi:uncharacterized protein stard9 isoform X2 [Paramisgurnus dabryanus]
MVSEREVTKPFRLAQGAVITLGRIHKFRFNHPAEAAVLRERRRNSEGGLISTESDSRVAGCNANGNGEDPRQRLEEQQWYIQCLREAIRLEQKKAERDLEREQARLQQQHTDIQKWILQEKQRLAVQKERGTLESGVQTDLSLLALVTGSSGVEESRTETGSPLFLMSERKRVVQEELLKHHTLRRAENRVRRKRLHYQLEKIARKRHLLEAKRELQRLENELLKGGDEALSSELGYPSRSRGRPMTLRRHSFSAELLSRLYPQHNPIFSQFLKRNRSSTSLCGFTCTTKSVFDECLQDQKIRRRSNTMPSRYQRSSSWQSSSESLKSSLKEARSAEMTETKAALSRLLVKKNASDQDKLCKDPTTKATRKVLPIIKQLTAQKGSVKGTKSLSQDRSKGLETIRKVFSRSVGPGIKTALAKVFRKPPSGSHGSRSVKSLNKTISHSDKTKTAKEEKCSIKSTKSCECLEQLSSLKYVQQRHWHSTETLTNTTNKLVEVRKEPVGWDGEDDRNGSSDCDSIYSLDSLSSAYATALAKQLKQEECDFSEAESDNSQMSQDSLVMESSAKDFTARPAHMLNKVSSHLTFGKPPPLCSFQPTTNKEEMEISKEVPAEVFWSSKFKMESDKGMAREISTQVSECRPCSGASLKEPDVLAFTDAWSSTDAVDSPRISMTSGHSSKKDLYTPRENSFCQSLTSLELSDDMNISEDQSSPRSDSTQGDIATLEEQSNTSLENTLILNSNESNLSFITVQKSVEMLKDIKEPTTNADTSPDDVAHTNKPTNNFKVFEYTATDEMMIHSFSKDGDISTGMDTLQCFQAKSSRKDQPVRGDNPSGYQAYPEHSSLKSDNLRSGKLLLCHGLADTEVKNYEAWQGFLNESHIGMDHHFNNKEDVKLNTFEECHEDYDCVYSKQCTKIATKDNALTIELSKKHDENVTSFDNEHFVVQLGSDPVTIGQMNKEVPIRNIKPPKKCDVDVSDNKSSLLTMDEEQSACSNVNSSDCSAISSELLTKLTTFEDFNMANKMENSNQELEMKEIKCATDAHKAVTNIDHGNIFRNDSSECDGELTTTNSEFENCKEEDKTGAIQIMERKMFNNRYFQMSDSAINDKISEVVKQHFTMSLREDCEEDLESDTTKEKISSAQLDHLKSKKSTCEFEYKDNHVLLVEGNGLQAKSSMAKSELLTDNTIEHLANYNTQTESRQSTAKVVNETPLIFVGRASSDKGAEQVGISDNMTSVEYCAIQAQGTDGQNVSESVVSHDSTFSKNTIFGTELLDASKTVQMKDFISVGNMESGKVTVINPIVSCIYGQVSPSLEQTNMLDEIREIDQQNAQMVNNITKSLLDPTKTQENTFDSKLLRHLKLFSETLCSPNTMSSESNIPQLSLTSEATVNHIGVQFEGKDTKVADTFVGSAGAMLPNANSEGQIKKGNINSISPKSVISVMDQSHENHHVSLSKLAFYEFGPGNLGKDRRSVSPDKMSAQHPLGNSTISIGICGDENKEESVDQIYHRHSSDDIRKGQILLDFNQALQLCSTTQSQRPQMDSVLKTCIGKNTPKDFPQSDNQLQMMTKGEQNCFNQYVKNHEPSALQKLHSAEPDKDMVKPLISEVYRNAKQTTANQNQKGNYNNTFKSKKEEHFTTVDDSKHVDNKSHDERQREKQKRYRKAHFKAPSSSSTDSTHDLSLDEGDASKMHVPVKGHHPKCALQTPSRQNPVVHNRLRNPPLGEKSTSSSSATSLRSLQTLSGLRHTQQLEKETTMCKGVHGFTEKMQKVDDEDINLRRNASTKDQQLKHAVLQARDSAMHFVSSDINPFIHTRTAMGLNRTVHKNQAFGSAANISCKNSPLNSPNKNITRCCSVDNGLNIQNSPFSSHLSTYANHKGLSSTLSSNEGSRDQISSGPLLMIPSSSSNGSNKKAITALTCGSYNGASEEFCHSSGQVDEIVLVCSSKYESQKNGHPSPGKCDHGVQTIEVDKDLKRRHCHRRSSTQTPVSKPGIGAPNTWTSLQNMSEHLSDLIYDTSDLLGNIQCMRTGERLTKNESPKNCFKFSTVNSGNKYKRDCSTQTSVDIGIQTETAQASKNAIAHDVNVIVKVIGSETCNVSQLDGNTKIFKDRCVNEPDFERNKSLPDLRLKTSKATGSQNSVGTPPKVVSLQNVVPDQTLTSLEGLEDKLEDSSLVDETSSSICPGGIQSSSTKGERHPTCRKSVDLRNSCNKKAMFMDRASSPILTVKAAKYAQQCPKNNQRLTNYETTEEQNTTGNQWTNVNKIQFNAKEMPNEYPINSMSPQNTFMLNERKRCYHASPSEPQRKCLSPPSSTVGLQSASSSVGPQSKQKIPDRPHLSSCNNRLSYGSSFLEQDHKSPEYTLKNWDHLNQNTPQQQEDDVMSIVPSECNTDVLLSINPLRETTLTVEHQCIPDDLPMHNKFTNWSGINQQPSSTLNKINRLPGQYLSPTYLRAMESERPEPFEETDRKTKEIVKLRKEREQVLASVHLDLSPHKLTVELTEAKLHYGQGETDTLLKILKSGSKEEPPAFTKQELLDRHRKSIESLKKERDVRLQMCRRARSLSPGNNRISPSHDREHSQRISDLPSRRREYLQQLRQEIVETSRVPDPPRREGQCPSDIELLLRDYSRAREEARAEIARARHRLRERTEQEKRRLQQQALAQAVKDDLRFRTRISNSTLCTGSNLSLSSGPTSGYNSSNTATLKDNTSPTIQINGVPEFKVSTRPPVIPLQTSKAQRRWLSVQDVSQETFVTEYEFSSTPSSPPCARQRTLSFGSPSSISASYQDIADCTLASAISEIYLASGGDVRNLLAGKATSYWRHQGVERGVQVFHKATAKTTAHGFLGAMELERPLDSLWDMVRDHSKTHLYHESVRSAWTRPLDECNQLVYLLTDTSNCQLKQPRDFCCLSTESKQDDMWVLAMQSIFDETMPRPSVDTVRGEMLPSAWILQPSQRNGQEVTTVIYMLQVDLGTPSLAPKMLNAVSRKQAAVIADLNAFLSL